LKPLRICLVSKEYPPTGTGGISSYVYRLAHGLAEAGHNVTVIAGPADSNRPDRPSGPRNQDQESDEALPTAHQPSAVKLSRVANREFWLPAPVRRKGRGIWNTLERSFVVDREIARLERKQGPFDVVEMPNWGVEGLCYSLHPRAPLVIRLSTPLAQVSLLKGERSASMGLRLACFLEALPARRGAHTIAHSETGILVERGSTAELANALVRLAGDAVLRQELGKRGYQRVRTRFTAERMVEETVACYRQVIAESGKAHLSAAA
jgi:glycosyltransferase involved in cell wall biosynthesis